MEKSFDDLFGNLFGGRSTNYDGIYDKYMESLNSIKTNSSKKDSIIIRMKIKCKGLQSDDINIKFDEHQSIINIIGTSKNLKYNIDKSFIIKHQISKIVNRGIIDGILIIHFHINDEIPIIKGYN